jgi:hypothetical protein
MTETPAARRVRMSMRLRGALRARAARALCGVAAAAGLAALAFALASAASGEGAQVHAFPLAGSATARPETQVSFRGAAASALGAVTVTGSRSGAHTGRLVAHSDGQGASFVPDKPYAPGEKISVTSAPLSFAFTVARRPPPGKANDGTLPLPTLPPAAVDRFRSRPDLEAPVVRITRRTKGKLAPGLIMLAPFSPKGSPKPDGPLITDNDGNLVYFKPLRRGTAVTDLKVQQLNGQSVLTWWQGRFALGWGYGAYQVLDEHYRLVRTIKPANGYQADLHDMQLTDHGTALVLAYDRVKRDLRFAGGAKRGVVLDNVVQEIDLATGAVVFEWHSLGSVPLRDSFSKPEGRHSWDYFHVNAVEPDSDGNLIVSGRTTCTIYKVNRVTGAIMWRLGGKHSDFKLGKGAHFCFQHDVRRAAPGKLTMFDNEAGPPVFAKHSRALRLKVDEEKKTATVDRAFIHKGILAFNQGSTRLQPNGNTFVGWGASPVFSEFSPTGKLLFDGRLTQGKGNYRAIRARWTGRPTTRPAVAARRTGHGGRMLVYASWNGATGVARWQVLAGDVVHSVRGVASKARHGFETAITTRGKRFVAVRALSDSGRVLGTSKVIRVPR